MPKLQYFPYIIVERENGRGFSLHFYYLAQIHSPLHLFFFEQNHQVHAFQMCNVFCIFSQLFQKILMAIHRFYFFFSSSVSYLGICIGTVSLNCSSVQCLEVSSDTKTERKKIQNLVYDMVIHSICSSSTSPNHISFPT